MKYIIGIGIKSLLVITVLFSIYSVFSFSLLDDMMILSILIVGLSFFLGDLFIVPRYGNAIGTLADFGLVFILLLVYGLLAFQLTFLYVVVALSVSFLIAIGEAFFHYYVQMRLTEERKDIYEEPAIITAGLNSKFQTEFAKENSYTDNKDKEK